MPQLRIHAEFLYFYRQCSPMFVDDITVAVHFLFVCGYFFFNVFSTTMKTQIVRCWWNVCTHRQFLFALLNSLTIISHWQQSSLIQVCQMSPEIIVLNIDMTAAEIIETLLLWRLEVNSFYQKLYRSLVVHGSVCVHLQNSEAVAGVNKWTNKKCVQLCDSLIVYTEERVAITGWLPLTVLLTAGLRSVLSRLLLTVCVGYCG